MHWFCRATIAVVLGGVVLTPALYVLAHHYGGPHYPLAQRYIRFTMLGDLGFYMNLFLFWAVPLSAVPVVTYALLTRWFGPKPKTRCRKCGYILKGITEPRCSECGERI